MVQISFLGLVPFLTLASAMAAPASESQNAVFGEQFFSVVLYEDHACSVPAAPSTIFVSKGMDCLNFSKDVVNSFQFVLSGGARYPNASLFTYNEKGCGLDDLVHDVDGNRVNQGFCYINNRGAGAKPLVSFKVRRPH